MSYDVQEKSEASIPFELYLFEGTGILEAYTSGDVPVTYLGNTFVPATISRNEQDVSSEVSSGQIKIYTPKENPIAQLLVPYLPASPVAVTVFGCHVGDIDVFVLFTGQVSSAHFTDECEMVCNSDQYRLQLKIPKQLYQAPCTHIFGDAGCGIDLATVTYNGVITAISPDGTFVTVSGFESLPHALIAGFFRRGNDVRMIVGQSSGSGNVVQLISGISGLLIGDHVQGTAGCQHTYGACQAYENVANFLGFDLVPILNPFNGSVA